MRTKISLLLGVTTLTAGTAWLAACSGDGGANDGGLDGTTGDSTNAADMGSGMDTGTMDTGTMDAGNDAGVDCKMLEAGVACRQCCRNQHMQGDQAFNDAVRRCVCMGNKCPSCANNFCMDGGQPSNPCQLCALATLAPDGGACFSAVAMACGMTPDCQALLACIGSCP